MADIWQQFHSLPKAIRDGVSSPAAIAAVDAIEAEHPDLDLANFIMRVVVHEFPVAELRAKLASEAGVSAEIAASIDDRLRRDVFTGVVGDYLGLQPSAVTPAPTPMPPKPEPAPEPQRPAVPPIPQPPAPPQPKPALPTLATPPANLPIAPVPTTTPAPAPALPTRPKVPPVMSQPNAPVGAVSPTTQYSDEDAAEIDAQLAKVKQLTSVNPNQDFDTIARSLLTKQNLAFSDELLDRRSLAIIKARLKSVRTTDETKDILMRDTKIGGLGLDQEIAVSLAAAADAAAQELKTRGMVRLPEQPEMPKPPAVPKVAAVKPEPKPPFHRDGELPNPTIPPNITEAPRPSRPIIRPADIPEPAPMPMPKAKPQPVTPASTPNIEVRGRKIDRPAMADIVRPTVQSMGPADELRSMTLLDFRRLGQGAAESTRRVLEKLDHLKRESFAVWTEAVRGWRQSDVMQLYLTMGRESLEQGAPISQIIATRTRQGQPYLSEHEFSVLADMNRHLQN